MITKTYETHLNEYQYYFGDYQDLEQWFVLSVQTNREFYIKQLIDKHTDYKYRTIVFSRELIHCNQNKTKCIYKPLFPGYIFIHKYIDRVLEVTNRILPHYYIKPICCEGVLSKVGKDEMMLLLNNCNDDGVFCVSDYYKEKDEVRIVNGPLKNLQGKIKFINEKKQKVNIEVSLFNRTMNISLGIHEIHKEY